MSCLDENTVVGWLEGALPPEARAAIDAHVAECSSCRELIAGAAPLHTSGETVGETQIEDTLPAARPASDAHGFGTGALVSGRYRVLAPLGRGGMGQVYRVSDALHPERALALKTLTLQRGARIELLQAEFRIMAELAHPHIARVYDFEKPVAGEPFFTMEYVDGRQLGEAARSQDLEQIVEWSVQACRALQYLHSRGVIHADFKPQNVLVTDQGVKVLDFGLSGAVGGGGLVGTPAYMAPELAAGSRPDERTDLYALGISLYQLAFGQLPFAAGRLGDMTRMHAEAPLTFPRESPLASVIERLCHKQREARPASANDVIAALGEAVGRRYLPDTSETRGSYVASGRLVGRERESDQLLAYCLGEPEEAMVAAVAGPSGVGKSRLLVELRRKLQLSGVPFLDAACYEGSFSDLAPLVEWSQALRVLGRASGCAVVVEEHAGALEWLEFSEPPSGPPADEDLRRARLRALASFVLALARSLRIVLHLGDVQWARSSTIDFLRLLYEELAVQREAGTLSGLRLVMSYRDDEVEGRPIAELLAAAPRRLSLALPPLDTDETGELIGALLGAPEVPEVFIARVSHETGGNPFFIQEVLRGLLERGDVYLQAGRWAAPIDVAHLELPTTIAAVLERRLGALDPFERALLDWLAIHAQPMPLELLAACCDEDQPATRARALRLTERHLVTCDERERVCLAHDKLREFLAARMPADQRSARHRRIAHTLDGAAGAGQYVFERAHHFWHGGDEAQAYRWAARAAELGERSFATDAAIDNYERLRRLARSEAERRAATEKLLALALVAGQYRRIIEVTAVERARRPSRLDRAWLLQLQGEALGGLGQLDEASDRLREAVALLGGQAPRDGRARRLFIAWHYLRHVAMLSRARSGAPALSPEERRRREVLGMSYFLLSVYAILRGDDEGVGLSFAAYNAARPLGRGELVLRLTQNVALSHHLLGHYRLSEQLIGEAKRMAVSDADHAAVLVTSMLGRQSTQRPMFAGQRSVHEHEAKLIEAVSLLDTRSKAIYVNVARIVATTALWQFAVRFRDRPEVSRWAEAMRGTVHYAFVQGGAAMMALMTGDRARAAQGWARAAEADATPFYRAWLDGNFAWAWGVMNDQAQALGCLRSLAARLPSLDTRTAMALPVLALTIASVLVAEARGVDEPWLRACLDESVRRLERRRQLPPYLELFRAVGRLRLGRGGLGELARAHRLSADRWQIEQGLAGHPDGCLLAALTLGRSPRAAERAASARYAAEALRIMDERYPSAFAVHVRELLRASASSAPVRSRGP